MQVVLNEIQISDLFFSIEKPELDAAYAESDEKTNELDEVIIEDALLNEAKKFSDLLGNQVTADWLVENFKARI